MNAVNVSLSARVKALHRAGHSHVPLKQFAREVKGPHAIDVREWFANKRAQNKIKRATPASGHGGLNWKRHGKKKSRGSSVSKDRSGKKGKKE